MRVTVPWVMWSLLFIEVLIIGGISITGAQGLHAWRTLCNDNASLAADVVAMDERRSMLKNNIASWHTDQFFCEKIAREELHMARPSDVVFFLQK